MSVTIQDIFKRVDELDTFLIESGYERYNELEIVSYVKDSSHQSQKITITIEEPNYNKASYND